MNGYSPFTPEAINLSDFSQDSWLAGFINADGGFKINITLKRVNEEGKTIRKGLIACKLVIEQRMVSSTGLSYFLLRKNQGEAVLAAICRFFGCNLNITTHQGRNYFVIAISSRVQLRIFVSYLNRHCLLSSKYLDYRD